MNVVTTCYGTVLVFNWEFFEFLRGRAGWCGGVVRGGGAFGLPNTWLIPLNPLLLHHLAQSATFPNFQIFVKCQIVRKVLRFVEPPIVPKELNVLSFKPPKKVLVRDQFVLYIIYVVRMDPTTTQTTP